MDDDVERLNRLLDDLAAERDPRERAELSAADVELAQTAAFLKAAHGERSTPTEAFVERLGRQLAAASSAEEQAQRAGPAPAPGLSRRGLLGRLVAAVAGLAVGAGAGADVAYEWGKQELARIQNLMLQTANEIKYGASVEEAIAILESDPVRRLSGIARHPLPRLRVRASKDGHLYVWAVTEHPTVTTLAPYTHS